MSRCKNYIQGNAENAATIKAAFKKNGCNVDDWNFSNPLDLYFNVDDEIYTIDYVIKHIITERQDYQQLELPTKPQPKFHVGQLVLYSGLVGKVKELGYYEARCCYRYVIGEDLIADEEELSTADWRDLTRITSGGLLFE